MSSEEEEEEERRTEKNSYPLQARQDRWEIEEAQQESFTEIMEKG